MDDAWLTFAGPRLHSQHHTGQGTGVHCCLWNACPLVGVQSRGWHTQVCASCELAARVGTIPNMELSSWPPVLHKNIVISGKGRVSLC